jgi:DNA-binding NarL/FixJ family response regulator
VRIQVMIVDDHPLVREGTRDALERSGLVKVVDTAANGAEALRILSERRPDVLLLDLHLPDMSGLEVARRVRTDAPEVAIVVITGYEDASYLPALLQLGVRGYLRKTMSGAEIVAALQEALAGHAVIAPDAVGLEADSIEQLTTREAEVLRLMAAGRRNGEIATQLGVSVKTIEFHIGHVLEKLGARSRTEAVLRARHYALIPLDPLEPRGAN